ncbi:hypothetical protein N7491_009678 [Penicillium cf. griseofulvum]|uniref:Uncharacterized protein n=1 Tax=Penicillium cf. griseofulvum TaxID=2972120 RepID=A0A9W9T548_9EURO|nr:hypothetical protein N7472_000007 [Penicillium cf. griseofulvum]KAJ5421233.1 hypothetical protein N7491_009678 [Penicillium cf. griseofulvum]KAJ5424468.1 hypothetical protein N7445_010441 [Penicillium cf. griseofulvum]
MPPNEVLPPTPPPEFPKAVAVNTWLLDLDDYFEEYPNATGGKGGSGKIQCAVRVILSLPKKEPWMKNFESWYRAEVNNKLRDWNLFKKKLSEHLIGKYWYIDFLKDFATYTQGKDDIDRYIATMTDFGLILMARVERDEDGNETEAHKWMRNIFKQYLVFRANPEIWQKLVKDKYFCDLLESDANNREEIVYFLRSAAGTSGGPRPDPIQKYTSSNWVGSGQGSIWSHLEMLPSDPQDLGNLKSVEVKCGQPADNVLWIQQLSVRFASNSQPIVLTDPKSEGKATKQDQLVSVNGYLESVTVYSKAGGIIGLAFTDSTGTRTTIGRQNTSEMTLSKNKHRIVGFSIGNGQGPSEGPWTTYVTTSFAVIYAPI